MANELYFISPIDPALRQPNPKAALCEAFKEIRRLGRRKEYKQGFSQFLRFMDEAARKAGEQWKVDPNLSDKMFDALVAGLEKEFESAPHAEFYLERDGQLIYKFRFEDSSAKTSFDDMIPGNYQLLLNTGWVLWNGALSAADLVWHEAYPERPLEMAADTGEDHVTPTRVIELLDGELVIRVFPGIESGRLEIELRT